jgi:hypothetical protein
MNKELPRFVILSLVGVFLWHGYFAIDRAYQYNHLWHYWIEQLLSDLGIVNNFLLQTYFLKTVGVLDLFSALCILLTPLLLAKNYKIILFSALIWMSTWGFLTALARVYFVRVFDPNLLNKTAAIGECLKRFPNFTLAWIILSLLFNFKHLREYTFSLLLISFVGYLCVTLGEINSPEGLTIHLQQHFSNHFIYISSIALNVILLFLFIFIFLKISLVEDHKLFITFTAYGLLFLFWSLDYWKDLPTLYIFLQLH